MTATKLETLSPNLPVPTRVCVARAGNPPSLRLALQERRIAALQREVEGLRVELREAHALKAFLARIGQGPR